MFKNSLCKYENMLSLNTIVGNDQSLITDYIENIYYILEKYRYKRINLVMDSKKSLKDIMCIVKFHSIFGYKPFLIIKIIKDTIDERENIFLEYLIKKFSNNLVKNVKILIILHLTFLKFTPYKTKWVINLLKKSFFVNFKKKKNIFIIKFIVKKLQIQKQYTDINTLNFILSNLDKNIMSLKQEIIKFSFYPKGKININQVKYFINNLSQYNFFSLYKSILEKNIKIILHILSNFKKNNQEFSLTLWIILETTKLILNRFIKNNSLSLLNNKNIILFKISIQKIYEIDILNKGLNVVGCIKDPWNEASLLLFNLFYKN